MVCKFKLKGLDCANCAAELERKVQKIEGVNNATVSFMTEKMTVELPEDREEELTQRIKKVVKKEEPDVKVEKV